VEAHCMLSEARTRSYPVCRSEDEEWEQKITTTATTITTANAATTATAIATDDDDDDSDYFHISEEHTEWNFISL